MSAFVDHCLELLAPLGRGAARRMFGGHGVTIDGIFVAIVVGERLYLKVDAQTQELFAAAGCEPFAYERRDGCAVAMSYWSAPADAMESAALMQPWARLAIEASLRARAETAHAPGRARAASTAGAGSYRRGPTRKSAKR